MIILHEDIDCVLKKYSLLLDVRPLHNFIKCMNNKYNRRLKNSLGWLVLWLTCTLCEGKTPINFKA